MAKDHEPPNVIDLARWRLKKLKFQSQEEYIDKLCRRCDEAGPRGCSEADSKRLAEIQREVILDLMRREGEPEDLEPRH